MAQTETPAIIVETIARYELDERDGVTQLRVTHSGFTSMADRDNHAAGLNCRPELVERSRKSSRSWRSRLRSG